MAPDAMLLLLGKASFGLAGLGAGARLLGMARAGHGRGPHAWAAGAVFVGGSGLVLCPLGQAYGDGPAGIATVMVGDVAMRAGLVALCVFLWLVFRPESRIAPGMVAGVGLLLFASTFWDWAAQPTWAGYDDRLAAAHAVQLTIALPFVWSCLETGSAWARCRRRVALGLSDAETAQRFLLWTVATASFIGICVLAIVAAELGRAGWEGPGALATGLRGVLYLVITGAAWRGFLAPSRSRRSAPGPAESAATKGAPS